MRRRVLLSWSSGKDSAWALQLLREEPDVELAGLLTAVTAGDARVAVHDVPRDWLAAQARAAGLPLYEVPLPRACPNGEYEARMRDALSGMRARGVTHVAFGDLFLEDIRAYRERLLEGTGLDALFPAWCGERGTAALARRMIDAGLKAFVACVDTTQLDAGFAGRAFDDALLRDLPASVDPCAERGEFHTFCFAGPMFAQPLPAVAGRPRSRGRFVYAEPAARA